MARELAREPQVVAVPPDQMVMEQVVELLILGKVEEVEEEQMEAVPVVGAVSRMEVLAAMAGAVPEAEQVVGVMAVSEEEAVVARALTVERGDKKIFGPRRAMGR